MTIRHRLALVNGGGWDLEKPSRHVDHVVQSRCSVYHSTVRRMSALITIVGVQPGRTWVWLMSA